MLGQARSGGASSSKKPHRKRGPGAEQGLRGECEKHTTGKTLVSIMRGSASLLQHTSTFSQARLHLVEYAAATK